MVSNEDDLGNLTPLDQLSVSQLVVRLKNLVGKDMAAEFLGIKTDQVTNIVTSDILPRHKSKEDLIEALENTDEMIEG